MSVDKDVIKVTNNEEEPLTSSPAAVSGKAVDKLSATAHQDTQFLACPHQGSVQNTGNEALNPTVGLCADQEKPLSNIEMTQIDCTAFKSAQPTENTDTSTCILEDQVRATTPLPKVNFIATSAGDRIGDVDAHEDEGEENTLLSVQLTSSGNGAPTHSHDRSPASASSVIDPIDRKGIEKQPGSLSPHHVDVMHDNYQTTCPTVLFSHTGSHSADAQEMHHDCGVGGQAVTHYLSSAVVQYKMQEQEHIACKTVAVEPSRNNSYEDAAERSLESTTNRPVDKGYAQQSNACAADDQSLVSPSSAPGAIILTEPYANSAQNASDATATMTVTTSELHDSRGTAQDPDSKHIAEPTGTPTSSLGVGLKVSNNDHESNGGRSPQSPSSAQNVTTNVQESHDDRRVGNEAGSGDCRQDTDLTAHSIEHRLTVPSTDQDPEESRRMREETPTMKKGQVSGSSAQITSAAIESFDMDGVRAEADASSTSTPGGSRFQSQPAAPLARSPSLPRTATRLTPQEIKLAELKAQKAALLTSLAALPAIQVLIEESQSSDVEMSDCNGETTDADITTAANKIVKEHIKLLHEYNELKDIGQGLMGLIADQRGVRIVEVQDEFGIDAND